MTEQALLPAPADVDGAAEVANRRPVLLAAAAGVVALLIAAYFLFFTGGSDSVPMGKVSLPLPKAAKVAPKTVVKKPVAAVVPATFSGVHSKDPFKPLVQAPPAPVATAAPGGTAPTGTGAAPMQVVSLTGVNTTGVVVNVNGKLYNPVVGSAFATYFKLVRLQGSSCATFLYGDESFDLCKGSTTTKQ